MWEVKILKQKEDSWMKRFHKIGDIVEIADCDLHYYLNQKCIKPLRHYKTEYTKKKCKACGHITNTSKKVYTM